MVDRAIGCPPGFDIELLEESAKPHPRPLLADADSNGSILIMHAQGDHGAFETRIGHSGHRQQQLARQETRLVHYNGNEPRRRGGQALSRHPSRL